VWISRVGLDETTKRSEHLLGTGLQFTDSLFHILHIIPNYLSTIPHINITAGQFARTQCGFVVGGEEVRNAYFSMVGRALGE
jgi:hypothetical protein